MAMTDKQRGRFRFQCLLTRAQRCRWSGEGMNDAEARAWQISMTADTKGYDIFCRELGNLTPKEVSDILKPR